MLHMHRRQGRRRRRRHSRTTAGARGRPCSSTHSPPAAAATAPAMRRPWATCCSAAWRPLLLSRVELKVTARMAKATSSSSDTKPRLTLQVWGEWGAGGGIKGCQARSLSSPGPPRPGMPQCCQSGQMLYKGACHEPRVQAGWAGWGWMRAALPPHPSVPQQILWPSWADCYSRPLCVAHRQAPAPQPPNHPVAGWYAHLLRSVLFSAPSSAPHSAATARRRRGLSREGCCMAPGPPRPSIGPVPTPCISSATRWRSPGGRAGLVARGRRRPGGVRSVWQLSWDSERAVRSSVLYGPLPVVHEHPPPLPAHSAVAQGHQQGSPPAPCTPVAATVLDRAVRHRLRGCRSYPRGPVCAE